MTAQNNYDYSYNNMTDDDYDYADEEYIPVVPICDDWVKISNNPIHWKHVNLVDYLCNQIPKFDLTDFINNPNVLLAAMNTRFGEKELKVCLLTDLQKASFRNKIIYQELMQKALHPSRVLKWIDDDLDF
jgi:hypothetical protein